MNATNAPLDDQIKETESAARILGVKLQPLEIRGLDDFDIAFKNALRE